MRRWHKNHRKGKEHPRWNPHGTTISDHGYVKMRVGKSHPLSLPNGFAYVHHVVWCSANAMSYLPKNAVIHHNNGNKEDNRIENLELISRAYHNHLHNEEKGRTKGGRFKNRK